MVPNETTKKRTWPVVISIATLVVVLSPIRENFRDKPADGFPLSYFPMFTNQRNAQTSLTHPLGFRRDGSEVNLPYWVVAGGGMNQVRHQIPRLIKQGKGEDLCAGVARTVARSQRDFYRDIVEVAIVKDRFQFDRFFHGDRTPAEREVLARCAVSRAAPREDRP